MTEQSTAVSGDTRKAGFDHRLLPPMMLGSVLNPIIPSTAHGLPTSPNEMAC